MTGALELVRPLCEAASASLVSAVWQGLLLAGAAGVGLRLLPRTPAGARFAIWFAVFLTVAGLPLVAAWMHLSAHAEVGAAAHGSWVTLDPRWSFGLLGLWIAASLFRGVTLIAAAVRVRTLWRRATPIALPDATWRKSSGRRAEVCTSGEVDRPSVIGFFAPRILIPAWLIERLSPAEIEQIVLHEAGHLSRADDWLNLFQKIALVVFPLNPVLAWVERRLCFERELACDERVLRVTHAPKAYAACLAALAEHRMSRRGIALVMAALGRESELGERVMRILGRGERMKAQTTRLVLSGAVLALVAGAAALERAPQLVAFSSGHAQVDLAAPAGQQAGSGVYLPARFSVARNVLAANKIQVQQRLPHEVLLKADVTPQTSHQPAMRPVGATAQVIRAAARQPMRGPHVQWMVMSTWTSSNGSGVVMTSFRTTDVRSPWPVRNTVVASSGKIQGPAVQQVYPYAAVPVQGGWILFQL